MCGKMGKHAGKFLYEPANNTTTTRRSHMERDGNEAMFLLNTIYNSQVTNLNASEMAVLVCIAKNATAPGVSIPASRNKIVDQTRLAKTTVDRCLNQVIKRGYLIRVKPSDHIKPAEYLINVQKFNI